VYFLDEIPFEKGLLYFFCPSSLSRSPKWRFDVRKKGGPVSDAESGATHPLAPTRQSR
jgi:hypothetical protein